MRLLALDTSNEAICSWLFAFTTLYQAIDQRFLDIGAQFDGFKLIHGVNAKPGRIRHFLAHAIVL